MIVRRIRKEPAVFGQNMSQCTENTKLASSSLRGAREPRVACPLKRQIRESLSGSYGIWEMANRR